MNKHRLINKALVATTVILLFIFTIFSLIISPKDINQGDAVRLLYIHVPTAWLAYLSFIITSLASLIVIIKRKNMKSITLWDNIAGSSAQIGLLFCGLTIILGMLWGKPTWGVFWTWDARLITTAVLFLSYCAYLSYKALPQKNGSQIRNAIVGIICAINIPIVHFSVNWWRTLHQEATVFNPQMKAQIHGIMAFCLLFGVLTFSILYVSLLINLVQKNMSKSKISKTLEKENIETRLKEQENKV